MPEYAAAREGAAAYFGAGSMLKGGQKFVTGKFDIDETRDVLGKATGVERQLFRHGFVSRMLEKLNASSDRRSVLNKIYDTPASREKIELVMGSKDARELEALLRIEGILDLARQRIKGNSWTARRLYDIGLVGGAGVGGEGYYRKDPYSMATGALVAALASGGRHVDQRVLQRVAELMIAKDPKIVQKGLQVVARSYMDALRSTDRRIAAVGARQLTPTMQDLTTSR